MAAGRGLGLALASVLWLAFSALPLGASAYSQYRTAFEKQGFVVVPGFATVAECDAMMERMAELVEAWDPAAQSGVFRTDANRSSAQDSDDYFFSSADRIHFFLEPGATDQVVGKLKAGHGKHRALNKVGHGLHVADSVFEGYAHSPKVAALTASLGWRSPVVPQSMYIFKQPSIGGEVTPHQDSSFLYTEPRTTCLGLWLALEDSTEDNGCLWARVGSHREPLRQIFKRSSDFFDKGNASAAKMEFLKLGEETPPTADPRGAGFVPLPVKKGDLVAIHGSLDHLSLPNTSPFSRHTFQLHIVEGPEAGVTWSPGNWLQYSDPTRGFPTLAVKGTSPSLEL